MCYVFYFDRNVWVLSTQLRLPDWNLNYLMQSKCRHLDYSMYRERESIPYLFRVSTEYSLSCMGRYLIQGVDLTIESESVYISLRLALVEGMTSHG